MSKKKQIVHFSQTYQNINIPIRCGLSYIEAKKWSSKIPNITCKNCLKLLGLNKAVSFAGSSRSGKLILMFSSGKSISIEIEGFEFKAEQKIDLENIRKLLPPKPIEIICSLDDRGSYYLKEMLS